MPGKVQIAVDPVSRPFAQQFIKTLYKDISNMQVYIEKENYGRIREIAHQIKGDGGTYGFYNISHLGALIQSEADNNNSNSIKKLVGELSSYLDQIEMTEN